MPTFAATERGYAALWTRAAIAPAQRQAAERVARRIIANRARYEAVQAATSVPWWWIGAIHDREAGGSFAGVLHNGERIIGSGRMTSLVPAGRGPFSTWEDAAIDALRIKGLERITDWSIARQLYEAERFNGFGYVGKGVNSPYLWAATSLQQRGKYVRDGVWSSTAWDEQLGIAAVLKSFDAVDPSIMAPKPSVPAIVATAGGSTILAGAAAAAGAHPLLAGAALAALVLIAAELRHIPGVRTMLKTILTNWKTTSAGGIGLLGAIIDILVQINTGAFDLGRLMTDATVIATALGLIAAKDSNVTGGTKAQ